MDRLHINEIFYSLQGEGTRAGMPCVFVRFAGCNLHCVWCDTEYSRRADSAKFAMTRDELLAKILGYNCEFIEFTGGEPMLEPALPEISKTLCEMGYTVAIETNGSIMLNELDDRVVKIVDVKCPGSGCGESFRLENIDFLNCRDEVKFVLASANDLAFARDFVLHHNLSGKCGAVLFSIVPGSLSLKDVAEFILQNRLDVRLQVQLHKIIWGADAVGV